LRVQETENGKKKMRNMKVCGFKVSVCSPPPLETKRAFASFPILILALFQKGLFFRESK